ncbi:MAG: hypothetical protein WBP93_21180 [Pyrinomonadaceae bacterium]
MIDIKETETDSDHFVEKGRSARLVLAVICALALTAGLFATYMILRKRHAEQARAQEQLLNPPPAPAASPEIQAYVDDAMIRGHQTLLGGTLQNISDKKITDLSVEMSLKRRKDGSTEVRTLSVEPKDLEPNEQGRYSLSVTAQDYSGARLLRVKSSSRSGEIAFRSAPGAQRPPERTPQSQVIIQPRPSPRGRGEEFINTPENPARVP